MRYRFFTADVFTDRIFGGNPLAVLPEADGLTPAQMQLVAREFNLSETAFVLPPEDPVRHTRRVRIFTPAAELPFAGHPTVGAAFVLAAIGAIPLADDGLTRIVFEEGVGPVPVTVRASGGRPSFAQLSVAKLPEFGPPPPAAGEIARVLSLEVADLADGGAGIQAASCGVPFLFVPVRDRGALGRARIDRTAWARVLAGYWAREVFVLAFDPERPGSDLRARMFAPRLGIEEDPATGGAAAALGGYLGVRATRDGTLRWIVEQGFEMGRPSLIEVEADRGAGGAITAVRVGGASVMVSEGEIEVPAGA